MVPESILSQPWSYLAICKESHPSRIKKLPTNLSAYGEAVDKGIPGVSQAAVSPAIYTKQKSPAQYLVCTPGFLLGLELCSHLNLLGQSYDILPTCSLKDWPLSISRRCLVSSIDHTHPHTHTCPTSTKSPRCCPALTPQIITENTSLLSQPPAPWWDRDEEC